MQLPTYVLAISALVPAIVLLVYVYIKDRSEKEPIGLLMLLLFAGAVMCFPAIGLERLLSKGIDALFSLFVVEQEGQFYFISNEFYYGYHIVDNFIGVALVEEGLKWLVLILLTRKNKNFNSLFDGIIYAVCVSLGFAALENVMYVLNGGITYALRRAFTAVPGHMFDAVFMGYYYSVWHITRMAKNLEDYSIKEKIIFSRSDELSTKRSALCSLLIPILVHGFYDFLCSISASSKFELVILYIAFYGFLIFLYFYCFKRIKKISKNDQIDVLIAVALFDKVHPGALARLENHFSGNSAESDSKFTNIPTINVPVASRKTSVVQSQHTHNFKGMYTSIPGTVESINIKIGQRVSVGTELMRIRGNTGLSSYPVNSTVSGIVHSINCSSHEDVGTNKVLCVIDVI